MNEWKTFDITGSPIAIELVREHGLNMLETTRIILTAPYRYKVYQIAKKHKKGKRTIAHPSVALKIIQRWVIKNYLDKLPVHSAATAYEQKASIGKNAERHVKNKYLMKLDFKRFFPSIKPADLLEILSSSGLELTVDDRVTLSRLLFWQPKGRTELQLSIGAPSSPKISNLIMYSFDAVVSDYCKDKGITYTRYADDLTFSTNVPSILEHCLSFVVEILNKTVHPKLSLNKSKTVFSSKKFNRRVTSLVLANDGKVSLGHDKKRKIRAAIHHFVQEKLTPEESQSLRGILAYANAVEPDFIQRMCKRYGHSIIERIKSYRVPESVDV